MMATRRNTNTVSYLQETETDADSDPTIPCPFAEIGSGTKLGARPDDGEERALRGSQLQARACLQADAHYFQMCTAQHHRPREVFAIPQ